MDKLQGNERVEVEPTGLGGGAHQKGGGNKDLEDASSYATGTNAKYTKGTSEFEGWGTALKPALEPITVARKPLEKGLTVAENCLKWGTGGINIDGCRVGTEGARFNGRNVDSDIYGKYGTNKQKEVYDYGRFPANLIHDGSQEVLDLFPQTKSGSGIKKKATGTANGIFNINKIDGEYLNGDSGSAARFFYCAKASKAERNRGCEGLEEKIQNNTETNSRTFNDRCLTCKKKFVGSDNTICHCPPELKITDKTIYTNKNNHPTIKPIALMEYLVKLVSREGAVVLDPFAGSGSTLIACKNLNRQYIGIEREEEYVKIAEARLQSYGKQQGLF